LVIHRLSFSSALPCQTRGVDLAEEAAGMMWGDAGRIYFWIRREDLLARDFDRSWLILQCC
jgi:uncharacterized protein YwqG